MDVTPALRAPVSVCLATHNGARHIVAQLQSVLAQLQAHDEVIVSDDASGDETLALVQTLSDPRIRILRNAAPLGVQRNFAQAMAAARHDLLFLCDQDDIWLEGKVNRCVEALQKAVLVVTDCRVVDADLHTIHPSFFALRGSRPGIGPNLVRNAYLGCCMAFQRRLLQRALPLPARVPMHDMWLGLVAETCGNVVFLPEPLSLYRRHAGAASDGAGVSRSSRWQQFLYRWNLVRNLSMRVFVCKVQGR